MSQSPHQPRLLQGHLLQRGWFVPNGFQGGKLPTGIGAITLIKLFKQR